MLVFVVVIFAAPLAVWAWLRGSKLGGFLAMGPAIALALVIEYALGLFDLLGATTTQNSPAAMVALWVPTIALAIIIAFTPYRLAQRKRREAANVSGMIARAA